MACSLKLVVVGNWQTLLIKAFLHWRAGVGSSILERGGALEGEGGEIRKRTSVEVRNPAFELQALPFTQ